MMSLHPVCCFSSELLLLSDTYTKVFQYYYFAVSFSTVFVFTFDSLLNILAFFYYLLAVYQHSFSLYRVWTKTAIPSTIATVISKNHVLSLKFADKSDNLVSFRSSAYSFIAMHCSSFIHTHVHLYACPFFQSNVCSSFFIYTIIFFQVI